MTFDQLLRRRFLRKVVSVAFAALLASCAVGPDYERPNLKHATDDAYATSPAPIPTMGAINGQHFVAGGDIQANWWAYFRSPDIDALVAEAVQNNAALKSAEAAFEEAHEDYYAKEGSLIPFIDANGNVTQERPFGTHQSTVLATGGPSLTYPLDIFGLTRREIEAAAAHADFAQYQAQNTYENVVAGVVTNAINSASLTEQISATQQIIQDQQNEFEILSQQFAMGAIPRQDLLSQEAELFQTEASLPALEKQLSQLQTQLSVLLGRMPSTTALPTPTLASLSLPSEVPISLPAAVIEHRPDILQAEAQLHQASANIGVATANMLPQISIDAAYNGSFAQSQLAHALSASELLWSFAANVAVPIFHGGALWHERKAAIAAYHGAYAQYVGTVQGALENISDSLHALQLDAETLKYDMAAEQAAAKSLELARDRVRMGAITYLTFLDAERTYQQTRIALVQAQSSRFTDTVSLIQALGGSMWNAPTQAPVSSTGDSR